jgi:hypothetical protein
MPVKSEIDVKNNVIIRKVIGELTIEDIKAELAATPQLAGFKPDMGAVWDLSEGTNANFDTNELEKLAQFVELWSHGRVLTKYRSAVFAPRDIDYGVARIYQAYIEIHLVRFEFSVFRELNQAIRWVNKTGPAGEI